MYRSTKGASKARRDQINAEIRNLKDLLPITDADKARLSYLHIMSLACMYTRKSVFFSEESGTAVSLEESARFLSFQELSELMQAMPGFLMLVSGEGKLLYLSDSVSDQLGHSMVDLVAQGDSVYDIIESSDHFVMRNNLTNVSSLDQDRLFRCHFNTSKSVRRQSAGNKLGNFFLACFYSLHDRDMRLQDAQDSVSTYLGFDVAALRSRSWYGLLHPQDLSHASAQHRSLLREGGEGRAEMVVRVQTAESAWVWLYMVLQLEAGDAPISSNNYVISEAEAWSVRQQLSSEHTQLCLVLSTSQQEGLSMQSPETLSSPDQVFTPGSSGLSGQSFDFSTAGCSHAEPMQLGEGDPRSSLSSLEEDSFFQHATISAATAPEPSPSGAASPTPVTIATTQQIKEFVCTPPYTPGLGGASFLFGDPLFSFDPTGTTTPPLTSASTSLGTSVSPELLFPMEPCNAALYEKLPPTPDSPGDGDCTVMTLPEVRGPLYVDVPLGHLQYPPDGLLTPEASPGKQSGLAFFSLEREREKERLEISLLARHISTLAEGFYLDPLLEGESAHMLGELYPIKAWRGLDGAGHFCSVQSTHHNSTGEPGSMAMAEGEGPDFEEPMEIECFHQDGSGSVSPF
ncbi:hypothetical protein NHX12_011030 [Muraenolepis orangiensis]|uniref:Uncharacterized protein n=1 Tax=Muraenolepis orangiensis TaxID=630683 RepID=A0A9Q0DH23_9TELE|nr:hypothetical protein NHX12_011030 [Muraenolepis orangiensis]